MEKIYQAIIVGAGPAGLIAGQYLKNALILDKKIEIGKPVQCGEGISIKALELQNIKPDPFWICSEIYKMERIMPNGKAMGRWHDNPMGYIIDREKFEKSLVERVKCEIKLNNKVIDIKPAGTYWEIITKNGDRFKSVYLIGADGPNSIVRRIVFKENLKIIPALEYLVSLEKEINTKIAKIYLDNEKYPDGYAWIFPKSKNTANIGVGGTGNLDLKFNEFLDNTVKKQFGNIQFLLNKSGILTLCDKNFRFFKDKAFLTGDAGGLVDYLFKGGMSRAMMSAKIAAECILKGEENLYENKIKQTLLFDSKLLEAYEILNSLNKNNRILNELGEVFEGKGNSYIKTLPGVIKFLSKPNLRKNFFKIYSFFSIWQKSRDYLW